LRERLGREWWWILNIVVLGDGGVLVSLLGHMGWVYGRIFIGVGGSSVVAPDLKWVMAPRLDSGMIFGVVI
jgi:integral membrane sensor domain MASE1